MIESDPKVVATIKKVNQREELPIKLYLKDALVLLQSVPRTQPNSQSILKTRAHLSDGRTKLIHIRILMMEEVSLYSNLEEDLHNYISSKYLNYLNTVKNKGSRDALIGRALAPITKRILKLKSAIEIINQVVGDYESKSYAINQIIEALKLGERE